MRFNLSKGFEYPWSTFYESLKIECCPIKHIFKDEDMLIKMSMEANEDILIHNLTRDPSKPEQIHSFIQIGKEQSF